VRQQQCRPLLIGLRRHCAELRERFGVVSGNIFSTA
jgi:hypothetical protein